MTAPSIRNPAGKWLAAAFLLLAAGIGALWHSAISAYETAVLRERGRELQAIAELKIEFVNLWLKERRNDAKVQAGQTMMASALKPGAGKSTAQGLDQTKGQLEALRQAYNHKAVTLLDRTGNVRLGAGRLSDFGRGATTAAAKAAMASGQIHVSRAYHPDDGGPQHIDIDVAAPVAESPQPGAPIVGALAFHLDSRIHLDPLLRRWPAPSGSGESFLFERIGDEIVYLTSLRHAETDALRKRVGESSLPAAMAAKGSQGVVEGIDYRGVPVLAAVGRVPGMPWYVVAKLDREEILVPVRREALWSGALSTLLVLALGLAMLSWQRRSRSELALAQEIASREALRASESRFRKLIENAWDFHVLFNHDMVITYTSPSVSNHLGQDLLGESITKGTRLVHPEDVAQVEEARLNALANPGKSQRVEHRLKRRDDRWLAVEAFFVNLFDDPEVSALTYTARDITQRREAEAQRLELARQQRDTLVREVHHRIKNHLQGLAGLLNQHKRQYPAQNDALEAIGAQIAAISVIHGLQGRDVRGEVRLSMLLREIAAFLGQRATLEFGNADNPVCHNCAWRVADEESVPVALVINELVTNAIKHQAGPADGQPVPVRIDCACNGERVVVTVRNPGSLPADFDFAAGSALGTGLTLVRSLLSHKGAALTIAAAAGMVESRLTLSTPVVTRKPDDHVASLR